MSEGFYVDLKLYLEGIPVPVVGATVSSTIGSPATANIEVIPDDSLSMILPRTVVHLFYLDSTEFKRSQSQFPDQSHYKLLFCGEVFSINTNKSGAGTRGASLYCLDFSNSLDTSFVYELEVSDSGTDIIKDTSVFLATDNRLFDNIVNSYAEVARRQLNSSAATPSHTGKQNLLGGVVSLIETLHGVQGLYYGLNPWITVQERRVRFIESLVGDSGETAKNVFESRQFSDWLKKRMASAGKVASFRQVLQVIFGYIFYDMVSVPTPKYTAGNSSVYPGKPNRDLPKLPELPIPGVTEVEVFSGFLTDDQRALYDSLNRNKGVTYNLRQEFHAEVFPFLQELLKAVQGESGALSRPASLWMTDAFREHPDLSSASSAHYFGVAVDFMPYYTDGPQQLSYLNVSFGSRTVRGNRARMAFMTLPGEPILDTEGGRTSWYHRLRHELFAIANRGPFDGQSWDVISKVILDRKSYSGVELDVQMASDYRIFCLLAAKIAKKYNLKYRGDPSDRSFDGLKCPLMTLLGLGSDPVHVELKDWKRNKSAYIDGTPIAVTQNSLVSQPPAQGSASRESLHSFVMRPNIWFCAPPKSNVIFPDMIQNFSTSREFMREASRLELQVGNFLDNDQSGSNRVTDQFFYAPLFRDKINISPKVGLAANKMYIFDHEIYSGVVPKFETMLDAVYFGLKLSGAEQEAADKAGVVNLYAPKVAHFHLLTNRYLGRSASAALTFSPHLIPGFPCAVIDSVLPVSEIQEETLTTQSIKLGMIQSVTHSISQGGSQSQVRLTHLRSHRTGQYSDDSFSALIGSDGVLTVQDPIVSAIQAANNGEFSIGSGIASSWDSIESGDSAVFWAGLASTCGFRTLSDLVDQIPRNAVLSNTAIDVSVAKRGINQDIVDISITETDFKGAKIYGGKWEGDRIEVLLRVQNFMSPKSNQVISVDPYSSVFTIKFTFYDEMSLIGFVSGSDLWVPMVLPGNKFKIDIPDTQALGQENTVPVEEGIRPTWVSDDYSNSNISAKIYSPFFGCVSVTDTLGAVSGTYSVPSVEESLDSILREYSQKVNTSSSVSGIGESVLSWIYSFTYRPVATLPETLANKDSYYDVATATVVEDAQGTTGEALKYNGGFHSNAVSFGSGSGYGSSLEYLDIKGLDLSNRNSPTGEPLFDLSGAEGNRLDPRHERAKRVELYLSKIDGFAALRTSSGIGKRG